MKKWTDPDVLIGASEYDVSNVLVQETTAATPPFGATQTSIIMEYAGVSCEASVDAYGNISPRLSSRAARSLIAQELDNPQDW